MKKFFKGLFFGGSIGTLLALFLAPDSGKVTQEKIKGEVADFKAIFLEIQKNFASLKAAMANLSHAFKSLTPLKKDMENLVQDFKFEVQPRLEQINETLEKINEDLTPAKKPKYVKYYLPKRK